MIISQVSKFVFKIINCKMNFFNKNERKNRKMRLLVIAKNRDQDEY